MKMRIMSLTMIVVFVVLITGCSDVGSSKPNFEVLNSKVNYLEIKGKKIYLTKKFKDFTLQFKGLGCLVNGEYDESDEIEIDSIDDNNPILAASGTTYHITCYNTPKREWTEEISISMHTHSKDYENSDEIYWWHFSSTRGLFDLTIKGKKLLFGNENRNPSTPSDLINIMGNDYEEEKSIAFSEFVDYDYNDYDGGIIDYSFGINTKENKLRSFMLSL